jgi:hypothetical protein
MTTQRKNGRGGRRVGAGRKPIAPEERRRNRVVIHLTDAELDRLHRSVKSESVSEFVRRIVFRYLARRRK